MNFVTRMAGFSHHPRVRDVVVPRISRGCHNCQPLSTATMGSAGSSIGLIIVVSEVQQQGVEPNLNHKDMSLAGPRLVF